MEMFVLFEKTLCMSVEAAFDTDCNGATVGSIMGMCRGADTISRKWSAPLKDKLHTSVIGCETVFISQCAQKTMEHLPQK